MPGTARNSGSVQPFAAIEASAIMRKRAWIEHATLTFVFLPFG